MKRDYPLTSDDLRYLAHKIDEIMSVIAPPDGGDLVDGDWRWGLRVTVWNQDGNEQDVGGVVAPYGDGWIGFYPCGIEVPGLEKP